MLLGGKLGEKGINVLFMQLLLIGMLVVSLFGRLDFFVFGFMEGVLAVAYLYVLFFRLRKAAKDFLPYALFFPGLLAFALAISFSWTFSGSLISGSCLFIGIAAAFLIFFAGFSISQGRPYTTGVVELAGEGKAVVRADFDVRTMTNAGMFLVDARKSVRKGDEVRLKVGKTLLGRQPKEII